MPRQAHCAVLPGVPKLANPWHYGLYRFSLVSTLIGQVCTESFRKFFLGCCHSNLIVYFSSSFPLYKLCVCRLLLSFCIYVAVLWTFLFYIMLSLSRYLATEPHHILFSKPAFCIGQHQHQHQHPNRARTCHRLSCSGHCHPRWWKPFAHNLRSKNTYIRWSEMFATRSLPAARSLAAARGLLAGRSLPAPRGLPLPGVGSKPLCTYIREYLRICCACMKENMYF